MTELYTYPSAFMVTLVILVGLIAYFHRPKKKEEKIWFNEVKKD